MTVGIGPCRHCGRRVPARTVCRGCGYDADTQRNRRDRFVWGLLGGLLVCSVVGAPLGVVLLAKAYAHHCAMTGCVVPNPESGAPSVSSLDADGAGLTRSSARRRGGF